MIPTKYIMYDYCDLLHFAVDNKIATWNETCNILRDAVELEHHWCYITRGDYKGKAAQIIDGYLDLIGEEEARIIYT